MGNHIASHLIPLLGGPARSVSRRRASKGAANDDAEIDEEAGDPKRLSKGYVVVRKKDLD